MTQGFGQLFIVSTPLGNLGDISARALSVLGEVDYIAAEDTRHTRALLRHFALDTPCISCHDHNEAERIHQLTGYLQQGQSVALVSDAGTPLISDPGFKLVRAITEQGFTVVPVPGACAITTALVASGLPSDRFYFFGFPPAKQSGRLKWLSQLRQAAGTYIFYESKHRLMNSLEDMINAFGADAQACVARELTKEYESFYRGTLLEIQTQLNSLPSLLGEFVVMVHYMPVAQISDTPMEMQVQFSVQDLQAMLEQPPAKKQLASLLAAQTSVSKQEWYKLLI